MHHKATQHGCASLSRFVHDVSGICSATCTTNPSTTMVEMTSLLSTNSSSWTRWNPILILARSTPPMGCSILLQTSTRKVCTYGTVSPVVGYPWKTSQGTSSPSSPSNPLQDCDMLLSSSTTPSAYHGASADSMHPFSPMWRSGLHLTRSVTSIIYFRMSNQSIKGNQMTGTATNASTTAMALFLLQLYSITELLNLMDRNNQTLVPLDRCRVGAIDGCTASTVLRSLRDSTGPEISWVSDQLRVSFNHRKDERLICRAKLLC